MTDKDRFHWDKRYASRGPAPVAAVGPPPVFARFDAMFPTAGRALDLACGQPPAITALSEVGATNGPFRVAAGEFSAAFADLDVIAAGEGLGEAWLLARARRAAAGH